jgi:hypothetical protein
LSNRDEAVIAILKGARRVWAVSAIHGEIDRLQSLHNQLESVFWPGIGWYISEIIWVMGLK